MAFAALAGLDTEASLIACIALGLAAVAALSFLATSRHRPPIRLLMAGVAAAVGAVIVLLENAF